MSSQLAASSPEERRDALNKLLQKGAVQLLQAKGENGGLELIYKAVSNKDAR